MFNRLKASLTRRKLKNLTLGLTCMIALYLTVCAFSRRFITGDCVRTYPDGTEESYFCDDYLRPIDPKTGELLPMPNEFESEDPWTTQTDQA